MKPLSHGFELTFLPRRPRSRWQEWRSYEEAKRVTDQFNTLLWANDTVKLWAAIEGIPVERAIWGKADIFRTKQLDAKAQPHESWCLEVNNHPMNTKGILGEAYFRPRTMSVTPVDGRRKKERTSADILEDLISQAALEEAVLKRVYSTAASLGLHPHVSTTKRDGTVVDYPNGGGHQHIQIDFWDEGSLFLPRLYVLENALCIDYANNPWIRWLFAHWADDLNSLVAVNLKHLGEINRASNGVSAEKRADWEDHGLNAHIHDVSLLCHSIKQRIAVTGKPCRPTLEFRFLDMPRTMEELQMHVRFISSWVNHHRERVDRYLGGERPQFTLTPKHYRRLTRDIGYAKDHVLSFMAKIGVDGQKVVDMFWERGYLRRMRYGKAV